MSVPSPLVTRGRGVALAIATAALVVLALSPVGGAIAREFGISILALELAGVWEKLYPGSLGHWSSRGSSGRAWLILK